MTKLEIKEVLYNNLGENEVEEIKSVLELPKHYDIDDTIQYIVDNSDDEDVLDPIQEILDDAGAYLDVYLDYEEILNDDCFTAEDYRDYVSTYIL